MKVSLLVTFSLLCCIGSGLGLQCFVCNTLQGDTNCEDSFDLPGLPGYLDLNSIAGYSKETDSMKKRIGYLKDCPGYPEAVTNDTANDMAGVTYTPYCRKRKAIIYGKYEKNITWRDCGFIKYGNPKGRDCYVKRSEQSYVETCLCDGNACNSATSTNLNYLLCVITFSTVFSLAKKLLL